MCSVDVSPVLADIPGYQISGELVELSLNSDRPYVVMFLNAVGGGGHYESVVVNSNFILKYNDPFIVQVPGLMLVTPGNCQIYTLQQSTPDNWSML